MGIKKETKKRICAVAALVGSVSAGGALVACGSEEKPVEKAGAEAGVYYFDAGGEEYTMALGDGKHVTLMMGAEKKEGTYGIKDGEIEIKFGKDDVARGAVKETEIALKYGGLDMRFYKKVYYEVRYDSVDGSEIGSVRVLNGKHAEKPADPVKENSMFLGWYVDEEYTMPYIFSAEGVSGDITLYAQWAELVPGAQEYVVRFDLNYETDEKIGNKQTIGGKLYDLPKPGGREGYEFKGWWISAYEDGERLTSEVTKESRIEENRTLYAVWEEKGNGNRLKTPLVSTEGKTVQWNRVEGASSYTVEVENTAGEKRVYQGLTATRQELELTEAGDYKITVTAVKSGNSGENSRGGESWYRYKALARVSMFSVSETSSLVYNGVENAERYYIKVECGNASHKHDRYDNGTSTYYNFANCTMQEGGIKFTVTAEAEGWASSTSVTYVYNRILDGVKEVAYEKETQSIRWASVKNATGYIVEVNGEREEITGTVYSVKGYDPGELKIKVTPKTKGYNSPKGTEITVRKEELAAPKGLELTGTELSWDAVKGAEGYTVKIGEKTYETDRNVYDITEAIAEEPSASGEYRISVKANGEKGSEYSDEIRVRAQTLRGTLKYGDGKVRWGSVIGATEYRVRVNGGAEKTITGGTESEVTLTRRGINEIEVMYAAGETESAWEKLEVTGYAVEFDSRGGTAVDTVYLATGDRLVLPSAPVYVGYIFNGWYNSIGGSDGNGMEITDGELFDIASDTVLFADWKNGTYDITLDYGSGHASSTGNGKGTVQYLNDYTLEVPVHDDGRMVFVGWYSNRNGSGERYTDQDGKSTDKWKNRFGVTMYAHYIEAFKFVYLPNSDSYSVVKSDKLSSSALTHVKIPAYYDDGEHGSKKVTIVDGYAFSGCSKLTEISIPDTVTTIAVMSSAFKDCSKLEKVNVYHVDGVIEPLYSTSDSGLLMYKNGTSNVNELVYVPAAKTGILTIPDTVNAILVDVFAGTKLETIIIPSSVMRIDKGAFKSSTELNEIRFLPKLPGDGKLSELSIADGAFDLCSGLQKITFPARMKTFNAAIFDYCKALTEIDMEISDEAVYKAVDGMLVKDRTLVFFPTGKKTCRITTDITEIGERAFYDADGLTSVDIPNWITTIHSSAFAECSALMSVTFNGGVGARNLIIGESAFEHCSSLSSIVYNNAPQITGMGVRAFAKCTGLRSFTVLDTVSELSESVFAGCSNLAEINLGNSLKTIGKQAFSGCKALTEISFPSSLTGVSEKAFEACSALKTVRFADVCESLTLGSNTFADCTSIKTISLPDYVTSLGSGAFSGCYNLTIIDIDENNKSFASYENVIYSLDADGTYTGIVFYPYPKTGEVVLPEKMTVIGGVFKNNTSITKVTIRSTVTQIDDTAFYGCSNLRSVEFLPPETAKERTVAEELTIGVGAFNKCTSLVSVILPERLTEVSEYMFQGCTSLVSVSIPSTVTKIGRDAFNGCKMLTTVTFEKRTETVAADTEHGRSEVSTKQVCDIDSIGYRAFYNCSALASVTIPYSVSTVFADAFYNCTALSELVFEDGDTPLEVYNDTSLDSFGYTSGVFFGCTALTEVTLPERLNRIANNMFYECTSLVGVNLPGNIKNSTFTQRAEKTATIDNKGVVTDASSQTRNNLNQSYGGMAIGHGAFGACSALRTVTCTKNSKSEGTVSFGDRPFNSCTSLDSVELPSRFGKKSDTADDEVWYSAHGGNSDTSYPFANCNNLQNVYIERGGEFAYDIDGVVYSASGKTLFYCPLGRTSITIPDTVETIGANAFRNGIISEVKFQEEQDGYTGDKTTLPDLTVGASAFYFCKSLQSIKLPSRLKTLSESAFGSCSNLSSVTFADDCGLTDIGASVFSSTGITAIVLPKTVTTLGATVFSGVKLAEITLPDGIMNKLITLGCAVPETIKTYSAAGDIILLPGEEIIEGTKLVKFSGVPVTEDGTYTVAANITEICDNAFFNNQNVKHIRFAQGSQIASIGQYAFANCKNLLDIEFPDDCAITDISDYAFQNCTSINGITVPGRVTRVGKFAFDGCSDLAVLEFDQYTQTSDGGETSSVYSIEHLDEGAFRSTGLNTVTLPGSVTKLGRITNGATTTVNNVFANCASLSTVTFAAGSEKLLISTSTSSSGHMFDKCASLTTINFNSRLDYLPQGIFYNYTALTTVTGINNITSIGNYAFSGCVALSEFEIPVGVIAVGQKAFFNCAGLTKLSFAEGSDNTVKSANITYSNGAISKTANITSTSNAPFNGCSKLGAIDCGNRKFDLSTSIMFANSGVTELKNIQFEKTVLVKSAFEGAALTNVDFLDGITKIGQTAFKNCKSLTAVTIPASVTTVDKGNTFDGCSELTDVTLNNAAYSDSMFANCTKLQTVNFAACATAIPNRMFYNCSELTAVTFAANADASASLTITNASSTTYSPFYECTSLVSVNFNGRKVSIGNNAFNGCTSLANVNGMENATNIGNSAFSGCALTSVTIGDSVTTLGTGAFQNNTKLLSVSITTDKFTTLGSSTFYGCTNLATVTFTGDGSALTTIGAWAFGKCSSLESIRLPDGITTIYNGAFENCTSLTQVNFPSSLVTISENAFYKCAMTSVDLPASVSEIGDSAFAYNSALLSVSVSTDSFPRLGAYMFSNCVNLATVEFKGEGIVLEEFGEGAFYKCGALRSITLPKNIKFIGSNAFANTGLSEISLHEGVLSVGDSAFGNCMSLTTANIPASVTELSGNPFAGSVNLTDLTVSEDNEIYSVVDAVIYSGGGNTIVGCLATKTGEFSMDNAVTVIESGAFMNSKVEKVVIAEGVTQIDSYTFYGCTELTSVTIPSSVVSIGDYAFRGCSSLADIAIPNGVVSIGNYAFSGCIGLNTVSLPETLVNLGTNIFEGCERLNNLVVPASVEKLTDCMFKDCTALTTLTFAPNSKLAKFGMNVFENSGLTEITVPVGVLYLNKSEFYRAGNLTKVTFESGNMPLQINGNSNTNKPFEGCDNLAEIDFNGRVTYLQSYAFSDCAGLSVVSWDDIVEIGGNVFRNCVSLSNVSLPSKLKTVTGYAFYGADVKTLHISAGVKSIEAYAFMGTNIVELEIPKTLERFGTGAFADCTELTTVRFEDGFVNKGFNIENYVLSNIFKGCIKLNRVSLSNTMTEIVQGMFEGCSMLEDIDIPASVTAVKANAFKDCSKLKSVKFNGNLLTLLSEQAFANCTSLTSVSLPQSLTYIGANVFSGCAGLTSIVIPVKVSNMNLNAFADWDGTKTIYVPGYADAEAAGWTEGWNGSANVIWGRGPDISAAE